MAAAGANAVLDALTGEGLLDRVAPKGEMLQDRLVHRLGQHPHVGDLRGQGLFRGVELVADRATKEPFDPGRKIHARVKAAAMENGLMCYPMGGTIDGLRGDHVLLAPPFIIEPDQIDELVDRLSRAIDTAVAA